MRGLFDSLDKNKDGRLVFDEILPIALIKAKELGLILSLPKEAQADKLAVTVPLC